MSRFITELIVGIKTYKQAYQFTNEHRLWKFYLIPAIINLLIFSVIIAIAWHFTTDLIEYLKALIDLENPPVWAGQIFDFIVVLLLRLVTLILLVKLYRFLVMILLSPVLGMIAEQVQLILLQVPEPKFELRLLVSNILRGLRLTIVNIFIELSITIPLMLLGLFIPFIAPFTTILIITTESYFTGFGAMDLRNEFLRFSGSESRKIIWHRKTASIGNGLIFHFLLFVPIVGILFAPIFSVVAGNLAIHDLENGQPTLPIKLDIKSKEV